MNKKNTLYILLIIHIALCPDIPSQHKDSAPHASSPTHQAQPTHLDNAHTIGQQVIVTPPKKDPTDCSQLQGKEMMDCMACQSSENFKKNIMNFNDRMAANYFKQLGIEEYHEALLNFTEIEWQTFYASRNPKNKDSFPKTLEEQKTMLKLIYLYAYYDNLANLHNALEYLWSGNTQFNRDSLEKLISDYHTRCLNGRISNSTLSSVEAQFYWNRKKIFNQSS